MEKITVEVDWCDGNYSGGWGYPDFGAIVITAQTPEGLKKDFEESLKSQIADMKSAHEDLPAFLLECDYTINYKLSPAAKRRVE